MPRESKSNITDKTWVPLGLASTVLIFVVGGSVGGSMWVTKANIQLDDHSKRLERIEEKVDTLMGTRGNFGPRNRNIDNSERSSSEANEADAQNLLRRIRETRLENEGISWPAVNRRPAVYMEDGA